MILIKSDEELRGIAEACRMVGETLAALSPLAVPGVSTAELDREAERLITGWAAKPAFKGYRGYPASICASVNNEVIHGIPSGRKLRKGDIISIDVGVYYRGFYGDAALTLPVGEITAEARKLLRVTEESLYKGIEKAVAGGRVSDIGSAVQEHVEASGFSVVRAFVGHGVGRFLHEEPQVPNFGKPGRGPKLEPGMTIAIEPMVNAGRYEVNVLPDGWTAVTRDGSLSAHFEHTVAITPEGPKVLTKP